jgi:hypothetical protein
MAAGFFQASQMAAAHHFFVIDDEDAGFIVHVPPRNVPSP